MNKEEIENEIEESDVEKKNFMRTVHTFVIRAGRMTDAQKSDYEELSGKWCVAYRAEKIDYKKLFKNDNPVIVEIGFGMGQATAIIAKEHPEVNYIGIEVHKAGVGRLLGEIKANNLENLYIIEHDAIEVLENMIANDSVDGFHVFFPDPWPKKKHHKRRLMTRPRTNLLCSKLKAGGYIYMATDWLPYAQWAIDELSQTEGLRNKYDGFAPHQEWRPETKFEAKGLKADRATSEIFFVKA